MYYRRGVIRGMASALMLLSLAGGVGAQRPTQKAWFRNIELCNGVDRTSPDIQIGGCTALFESGKGTPQTLVIAYNNRGNAYSARREYDHAVQDYDQSIKLNPNYVQAFNNRGVAYLKKGDYDRAMEDFDESIKLNPNYANAFANRAQTYLNMGQWDSAINDYNEALRFNPKLASSLYGRGVAKLKTGDTTGGNADIAAARAIDANIVGDFMRYGVQ